MNTKSKYGPHSKYIKAGNKVRLVAVLVASSLLASCVTGPVQLTKIQSANASGAYIVPFSVISGMTDPKARTHILDRFPSDSFPTEKSMRVGRVYRVVPICNGVADWSKAYDETVGRSETIDVSC